MNKPTNHSIDYGLDKETTAFKKGIDIQREYYKRANLMNNYEIMANSLENIKLEIKSLSNAKGGKAEINKVEKIINWYKKLPMAYRRRFETGYKVKYPVDINIKINHYLNTAYEILMNQLKILGLLQ